MSINNRLLILLTFVLVPVFIQAQNNVGINTEIPDASAALDIVSANKGLLIPRMTFAERDAIASPALGLLVFATTDSTFYFWDGAIWTPFLAGNDGKDDLGNHRAIQNLILGQYGLTDTDEDTKIELDNGLDNDEIRFTTRGTQKAVLNKNGHFGLGVSNPAARLHVLDGSIRIDPRLAGATHITLIDSTTISDGVVGTIGTDGSRGGLRLRGNSSHVNAGRPMYIHGNLVGSSVTDRGILELNATRLEGDVNANTSLFRVANNSNALLTLKGNGFLGIGTITPAARLEVQSGNTTNLLRLLREDGSQVLRVNQSNNLLELGATGESFQFTHNGVAATIKGTRPSGAKMGEQTFSGFGTGGLISMNSSEFWIRDENNNTKVLVNTAGNLGIGLPSGSPSEKLEVHGSLKMVDGNEANGLVMISDANGVASWQSAQMLKDTIVQAANGLQYLNQQVILGNSDKTGGVADLLSDRFINTGAHNLVIHNAAKVDSTTATFYGNGDVLFGYNQLTLAHKPRFYWDHSKGAVYFGKQNVSTNPLNLGNHSLGIGQFDASGDYIIGMGSSTSDTGRYSVSIGSSAQTRKSQYSFVNGHVLKGKTDYSLATGVSSNFIDPVQYSTVNVNQVTATNTIKYSQITANYGNINNMLGTTGFVGWQYGGPRPYFDNIDYSFVKVRTNDTIRNSSNALIMGVRQKIDNANYSVIIGNNIKNSGGQVFLYNGINQSTVNNLTDPYYIDNTVSNRFFAGFNNGFDFATAISGGDISNGMRLKSDNTLQLMSYGAGVKSGVVTQLLAVDALGNIVETPPGAFELVDADGDTKIQVEESTDEDRIRFDTKGQQAMLIDNNKRVAIGGHENPTATLHIAANDGVHIDDASVGYPMTIKMVDGLKNLSNTRDDVTFSVDGGFGFLMDANDNTISGSEPGFSVYDSDSVSILAVKESNGRVGVNNINPTAKFDVVGGTNQLTGRFSGVGSSSVQIEGTGTGELKIGRIGGTQLRLISNAGSNISNIAHTNGVTSMIFNMSSSGGSTQGGVGVGSTFTAASQVKSALHVRTRNAADQALILQGSASQTTNMMEVWDDTDGVYSVVDEVGRIGLGTTNPDHQIHIRNDVDAISVEAPDLRFEGDEEVVKISGGLDNLTNDATLLAVGATIGNVPRGNLFKAYDNQSNAFKVRGFGKGDRAGGFTEIVHGQYNSFFSTRSLLAIGIDDASWFDGHKPLAGQSINMNITGWGGTTPTYRTVVGSEVKIRAANPEEKSYGYYADVADAKVNYAFYGKKGLGYFADSIGVGVLIPDARLHINTSFAGPNDGINFKSNYNPQSSLGITHYEAIGVSTFNGSNNYGLKVDFTATSNGNQYGVYTDGEKDNYFSGNIGVGTSAPDEKLHVEGSVKIVDGLQGVGKVLTSDANGKGSWTQLTTPKVEFVAVSSNFTITTEEIVYVDASSANVQIALPAAASREGLFLRIKKTDTSGNTVTLDPQGTETIDGASSQVTNIPHSGYVLSSDGNNWFIVGKI